MKLNFIVGNHRNFTYPYSSTENWFAASKLPFLLVVLDNLRNSKISLGARMAELSVISLSHH